MSKFNLTKLAEPVTLTIAKEENLIAGAITAGKKLASVSVMPAQATDTIALRFSDDIGQLIRPEIITLNGENNADNKLSLSVNIDDLTLDASNWMYGNVPGVVNTELDSSLDQTVAADTYKVSMDAGIWTN